MKSILNFMKTMLIMPIQWQIWLGVLVTANIVVPFFFIHTLEAQVVMATAIVERNHAHLRGPDSPMGGRDPRHAPNSSLERPS